jgi:hypothetical protein
VKLEKIYKDIFEANVGDKLFADPDAAYSLRNDDGIDPNFYKWVEKVYGPDYEPNTEEENKMLFALGKYFGQATYAKELGKYIDDLKALKSKFPSMLDPKNAKGYNQKFEGYAMRGAKLPIDQYEKLIRKSELYSTAFDTYGLVNNPGITYKSRGQYGFTSFSTDFTQAAKFGKSFKEKDWVGVVYGVKLSDPNLVVNPSFANELSDYKESEILYAGNDITPDFVIIVDPRFESNFLYDIKAYEEENDLEEFSIKKADFYPKWAKTHTPRLNDFTGEGYPKLDKDKKTRLDKKPPEEQAKIDKLKAMQAKKYATNESTKLYEVYTEILTEIGSLDPSKALPYELTYDDTRSVPGDYREPDGPRFVKGKQEYAFHFTQDQDGYPSKKIMIVKLVYEGNGTVRIDFNPAGVGEIPILGDSYKSAYTIMNTVGTIVKQSLKDTLEKGITKTLYAAAKLEYDKENPEQRQQMYDLFIKKAFPGAVINRYSTTLPDNYTDYL